MITYETGEIVIAKNSGLDGLRLFASDFGRKVYDQSESDELHRTIDVGISIDSFRVSIYFTYYELGDCKGDIFFYQEEFSDDEKNYRLKLANNSEIKECFEGDPKRAINYIKENLKKYLK